MKKNYMHVTGMIFALSLILTLLACSHNLSSSESATPSITNSLSFVDTSWLLITYGDPFALQLTVQDNRPTMAFSKDNLSGFTGCNSYGVQYKLSGDSIKIDNLTWTEESCTDSRLRKQEADVLALLPTVDTFDLDGKTLILLAQGNVFQFRANKATTD